MVLQAFVSLAETNSGMQETFFNAVAMQGHQTPSLFAKLNVANKAI